MPGAGKTTLGKEVARMMEREFIDLDDYVIHSTGKTSAQWIVEEGEAFFREIESQALQEATAKSGIVIATGGGSVLKEENRKILRERGTVYWIRRPLEMLETTGRPLSVDLNQLYEARKQFYKSSSDFQIHNEQTLTYAAQQIINSFSKK